MKGKYDVQSWGLGPLRPPVVLPVSGRGRQAGGTLPLRTSRPDVHLAVQGCLAGPAPGWRRRVGVRRCWIVGHPHTPGLRLICKAERRGPHEAMGQEEAAWRGHSPWRRGHSPWRRGQDPVGCPFAPSRPPCLSALPSLGVEAVEGGEGRPSAPVLAPLPLRPPARPPAPAAGLGLAGPSWAGLVESGNGSPHKAALFSANPPRPVHFFHMIQQHVNGRAEPKAAGM